MKCQIKLKDEQAWMERTGKERYANIVLGNTHSTEFIIGILDRYLV